MDFTVNLLVRSVIRTTHPLAMCPPNPFTEVLLVNPGYWGAYPRVLRVLTVHQKLEPNRGMNFLRTRETFCLSNLKKKTLQRWFLSQFTGRILSPESPLFRWMSETFDCVDFTHLEKKRSQVFCYAGEMRHVATWPSTCLCHATETRRWLVMTRHATDHKFQAPQILADHLCDALVFSCKWGTSASFHFNDFSTSRIVVENFNRGFGYQFRSTMAETFLSRRNDQAEQSSWQGEMTLDTSWDLYICIFYRRRRLWLKNEKCWVPKQTS